MTSPVSSADASGFPNEGLLRTSLRANAAFSALSGLTLLLFTPAASGVLGGAPPPWLQGLGASLLLFAVTVAVVAGARPIHPMGALVISLADVGWVVGSAAVVALWGEPLGGWGILAVSMVALAVAGFAWGQLSGLRRYARNEGGRTSAGSRFDFVRQVPADVELVWERVRALDRIGEFYEDLTRVQVEEKDGVLQRTCAIGDSEWSERVLLLDDEARELVLEFDVSGGSFPVPAKEMRGGWVVTPAQEGSTVHLWYEYTLRWGWAGEILAALMASFYRRQLGPAVEAIGGSGARKTVTGT